MKIKKINEKMMIKSIILMNYFSIVKNIFNILSDRLKENKYIYNFTYI